MPRDADNSDFIRVQRVFSPGNLSRFRGFAISFAMMISNRDFGVGFSFFRTLSLPFSPLLIPSYFYNAEIIYRYYIRAICVCYRNTYVFVSVRILAIIAQDCRKHSVNRRTKFIICINEFLYTYIHTFLYVYSCMHIHVYICNEMNKRITRDEIKNVHIDVIEFNVTSARLFPLENKNNYCRIVLNRKSKE